MLSLSVIMLNFIMLIVMAPYQCLPNNFSKGMEIWNPADRSVTVLFQEIPPEYGQSVGW